ncbi:diguanylate cyclase domain-containing protein [Noviherbaspirillum saxi]|nr:diguanylate cyclase [Noviherbaspirillum saxi]
MHDIPVVFDSGCVVADSVRIALSPAMAAQERIAPCNKPGTSMPGHPNDAVNRTRKENEAAFESNVMGVMVIQGGVVMRSNQKLARMYGYTPEHVIGMDVGCFFLAMDYHAAQAGRPMNVIHPSRSFEGESYALRDDGTVIWTMAYVRPLDDPDSDSSICFVIDITESKRVELSLRRTRGNERHLQEKIRDLEYANAQLGENLHKLAETEQKMWYVAHHDPLTGLANRILLTDRLSHAIQVSRREQWGVAVMFIDLDGFKRINDTLGHDAGDRILSEVALRLRKAVRESDLVVRMSGDEFVILMEKVTHVKDARLVARKLLNSVKEPVEVSGQEIRPEASIGISHFPEHGGDNNTLLYHADIAMYHAKNNKSCDGIAVYDASMCVGRTVDEVDMKRRRRLD